MCDMHTLHEKYERAGKSGWRMMRSNTAIILMVSVLAFWVLLCLVVLVAKRQFLFTEEVVLSIHKPPRTVVSLSSFSQRVFHMQECLNSILKQSLVPDRIIVTIPLKFRANEPTTDGGWMDSVEYDEQFDENLESIVDWFRNFMHMPYRYSVHAHTEANRTSLLYEFGNLTVQFLQNDWGPATKLLGALLLETDPGTVIITVDDDMMYNHNMVEWLAIRMKSNIVLSFGCESWWDETERDFHCLAAAHDDHFLWTIESHILGFLMPQTRICRSWLLGFEGVAYHVSSFGNDIWTFLSSLPIGCFYNDDIWIAGYVAGREVQRVASLSLRHHKHARDVRRSLSTIVTSQDRKIQCARHLFPTHKSPSENSTMY
jgi:hypothetical protein